MKTSRLTPRTAASNTLFNPIYGNQEAIKKHEDGRQAILVFKPLRMTCPLRRGGCAITAPTRLSPQTAILPLSLSLSYTLTHSHYGCPQQSRSNLQTSRQTAGYLTFECTSSHCNGLDIIVGSTAAARQQPLPSTTADSIIAVHRSSCRKK